MLETGGWFYPVLFVIGLIVVCTAMELLSVAVTDKAAGKALYRSPGSTRDGRQKAA